LQFVCRYPVRHAEWAVRIPQIKRSLGLDAGELGLVLLSICGLLAGACRKPA